MNKILFVFFFLMVAVQGNINAQTARTGKVNETGKPAVKTMYNFYFYLTGVNTREDLFSVVRSIGRNTAIQDVGVNKFPCKYFFISSNQFLTEQVVLSAIDASKYQLTYFGEGEYAREKATMAGYKSKKN